MTSPTVVQRIASAAPLDVWPDPMPLQDELPAVLPFNADLLPSQLRSWVQDIAERMNCPMDLVAIPAMVAAGSLIGRRVGVRPQRRTNWQEAGNLWGCVVARPGSMKSPAATEALAPLRRLELKAADEYQSALSHHKAAESLFKIEREEAEKSARATLKDKGKVDPRGHAMNTLSALVEPQPPAEPRFLTSDVTAEKLGEICAANPNGIMVHRDELLSLFSELDQAEKASAREFFLTGWGGMDGYTFDRIMRGTVRVAAVNVSIFGTTQPSRFAGYVRESLKRFDDGMVQRLQLLAWPDFDRAFQEADRYPDSEARQAVTLDNVFAEMVRRMSLNMGEYLGATETYARIALKAQANSRATLDTLTKLHQPREQTVRHVHVSEGGQAVIAEQFHHHGGGQKNGQSDEQPHATGTGAAGASAALPSPDPLGKGVPLPGGEREPAMQDARRQGKWRTARQP